MAVKGARCAALTRGIYICRAVPSGCGSLQASWGNRETPKARVPRFPAPLPAPSPGPRAHCVHHGRLGYRAVAGHRRKPPSPADTTHPTRAGGRGNSPPRGKDAPCETLPSLEPGAQVSPDLPALTRPANVRHCPPTAAAPGCTAAALARALNPWHHRHHHRRRTGMRRHLRHRRPDRLDRQPPALVHLSRPAPHLASRRQRDRRRPARRPRSPRPRPLTACSSAL
jgi:hypothetical protein